MHPSPASVQAPLRVAVVGAGYFAQFHLEAWQRLEREGAVELAAICDADANRCAEASRQYGARRSFESAAAMLDALDCDLLDIATPPATHADLVTHAVQRGLSAICQKPVAPTLDEAQSIAQLVAGATQPVFVHENFRWMPWYREMRQLMDDCALGQLHSIAVRMRPGDGQGPQAYLARQPYFRQMPRFLVHETLVHYIDTFRFLLGPIVNVTARLRRVNPAIRGEDAGYVMFEFAGGATGLIDANRLNDHSAANPRLTMGEVWLEGAKGVLRLDGDGNLHFKPHGQTEAVHHYNWANRGFGGDCVYAQQAHVVRHLRQGEPAVNLVQDYLANVLVEEAIYQSAAENRTIQCAEFSEPLSSPPAASSAALLQYH